MCLLEAFGKSGPLQHYCQVSLVVRVMSISIMICSNQRKWGSEWHGQWCHPRGLWSGSGIHILVLRSLLRSEVHHCLSEEYLPEGPGAHIVLEGVGGVKDVFGIDECSDWKYEKFYWFSWMLLKAVLRSLIFVSPFITPLCSSICFWLKMCLSFL